MIVILDVSAAIEIILQKSNYLLLQKAVLEADMVLAPDIFIPEISNVAWKYHKLGNFSHEQSVNLSHSGLMLIDQFVSSEDLWRESLSEAVANDHSVYDLLYLICARRNDGIFLTIDKKLQILAKKLRIKIM
ncbi:MAG: type II toxin-antitoxin system VapC family toxin [Calditrichaceae bacterium]|nr:type II toxin-antitoxin system VapC family toxin [Calditrichaceae bacterium]MBN2709517.1 type II toxin-antitoxin system VapC family toxin [Calditrichaceae bacterium]RQV93125.1 MAG: PIN domain nuclease [Calditrichota bacterium]